jgi:serine/threonine protein kinase/tetratricopeptide (TPR) repeat protein
MIGRTVSHYKILEKLGEGGMGVVYRAEDARLKRIVALKFLPERLSGSPEELARFQLEAEAISALNHPNIATIYDIGEADGAHFLALEYLPGGTLKTLLRALKAEGRELPIADVAGYAAQLAEGLAHAHGAGIVHRDIKSDNVMLTADGKAKITDFGLAKLRGASQLTKSGSTLGTLAYMAPEQMRGEEVDARADLFSLGVVLFELLTNRMPFRGEHEAAIMYSVLHEEPLPPEQFRSDVPAHLRTVISRALRKDPSARYQSAGEVLADLRTASAAMPARAPEQKSIVVLPFDNLSPDKENEYFSDGLTDEIIADLSSVRSLRVISRTSAMRLKGSGKDVRTIALDVGVRYVLEGSVRKAGQSLRITAQLIDGASDATLWTEKYSGTLEDVFEIQEKVSRAIVGALKVVLSTEEERRIEARPIGNAQAHDLFLRARQELQRGIPASLDKSIALLNEGLALVGENEYLYAALGHTYYSYFRWISKVDASYLSRAAEYVQKVFALNPSSSHGFTLQGMIYGSQGDVGAAIRSLKRASAIDPSNAEAHLWLAASSAYAGKVEDAAKAAVSLASIDPFTPITHIIQGVGQVYQGDFEGALPWMKRAYEMDPQSPLTVWTLLIMLAWSGRTDAAAALADELARLAPGWVYTHHALFLKHALRGEKSLALSYDTAELALEAKYDLHFSLHVAHCFALVGEKEKALDYLEHAIRMGLINHPFLSRFDPLLEGIRGEARFTALMNEAKQRMDQLSV